MTNALSIQTIPPLLLSNFFFFFFRVRAGTQAQTQRRGLHGLRCTVIAKTLA